MTNEEDKIAFNQWFKDHGHNFPGMKKDTLYYVYRSMDEENKREFLEEAREGKKNDKKRNTWKDNRLRWCNT